jgi:hypothetical protein
LENPKLVEAGKKGILATLQYDLSLAKNEYEEVIQRSYDLMAEKAKHRQAKEVAEETANVLEEVLEQALTRKEELEFRVMDQEQENERLEKSQSQS